MKPPALASAVIPACGAAPAAGAGEHPQNEPLPANEAGHADELDLTIRMRWEETDAGMGFEPSELSVEAVNTIRPAMRSAGNPAHEIILGTRKCNAAHKADIAGMCRAEHDDPDALRLAPAGQGEIVRTVSDAGTFPFARPIAGHPAAGMHGPITVNRHACPGRPHSPTAGPDRRRHHMTRRIATRRAVLSGSGALGIAALLPRRGRAAGPEMHVLKDPACGCCSAWIGILERQDFEVTVEAARGAGLTRYKIDNGIPPDMISCHTGRIEGYMIEGHVPVADIRRLLAERPEAIGLAVPGMPYGAPGMGPASRRDAYDVHLIRPDGTTEVFTRYDAA